jgi:hypothetical protein
MVQVSDATLLEWDVIAREPGKVTCRLPVPGGWLYRQSAFNPDADPYTAAYALALVFVPEPRA